MSDFKIDERQAEILMNMALDSQYAAEDISGFFDDAPAPATLRRDMQKLLTAYGVCIYFWYMNNVVINIKTDSKTKKEAQKIAAEFGVSLSSLVTMSLRNIIRNKRIAISLIPEVEPTKAEIKAMKQGIEDVKNGNYVTLAEL